VPDIAQGSVCAVV